MSEKLKQFIQRWVINTLAVLVATHIVKGIHYDTISGLIVATLLLGILNTVVRPILMLISLPLLILTLGLFTLVINAVLLYLVGQTKFFHVDSFWAAFWGALVISIISLILNTMTGTGESRVVVRKPKEPEKKGPGGGDGPVIDV